MPGNDYNHRHQSHPKSTICPSPTPLPPLHPSLSPVHLDNHHLVFTPTGISFKLHISMLDLLISLPTPLSSSPSSHWLYRIRHTYSCRSILRGSSLYSVFRRMILLDLTPHYYISCLQKLSLSWRGEPHYPKLLDHLIRSFLKLVYRPCLTCRPT